jgi:hypothetical protein
MTFGWKAGLSRRCQGAGFRAVLLAGVRYVALGGFTLGGFTLGGFTLGGFTLGHVTLGFGQVRLAHAETAAVSKPTATAVASADPAFVGSVGELPAVDRDVLVALLHEAGVKQAKVRSVERSPERQVKVMLELASADLEHAKAMYCQAGDEVLSRFDPNATREKNHAVMLEALVAILPKAREIGCLNHVRNDDVITVDVSVESVPEAQRAALVKAGEAAVVAKKLERFLAPPREPDSFHFEFKRREAPPSTNPAVAK